MDAHLSLLMASRAFLPSKVGEARMRVAPYIKHTIVPATEPRQWYKGLGRTIRNSSGIWRWRRGAGSILEPEALGASLSNQQGEPPPRLQGLG